MNERIIFCRMDKELRKNAKPKYPNGADDKDNLTPCSDGVFRGYVEIGLHGEKDPGKKECFNQIHIEKIDPAYKNKNEIGGVTIVFCSACGDPTRRKVVGWYRNATVYRFAQKHSGGKWFYFETQAENVGVPTGKMSFVPRASKSVGGMGQSGIWYPPEDSPLIPQILSEIKREEQEKK